MPNRDALQKYFEQVGRIGGLTRARNTTPEQRAEISRRGGLAAAGKPRPNRKKKLARSSINRTSPSSPQEDS